LTEAGYRDGFNVTIGANAGNTTREQMATFLQGQLARIGIRAKVEFTEWSTFITSVTEGRFEMVVLSSLAGVPDPDTLYADYHSQGASNYGKYSNPQVDKLLEQARATLNQEQRKRLYLQVERALVQDLPRIWAYDYLSAFATRASISNIRPSVLGSTWDAKYWRKGR
jgi:peptide/nickel transport system substrate-binding protein